MLQKGVAVSNVRGKANFSIATGHGKWNSMFSEAMPRWAQTTVVPVQLLPLSELLKDEDKGVYLLKIDAQGAEWHDLEGAKEYIKSHKVYIILIEYFPKGLAANGIPPLKLLKLVTQELGYQCYDVRQNPLYVPHSQAHTIEEFTQVPLDHRTGLPKYSYTSEGIKKIRGWGFYTDLMCYKPELL